MDAGKSPWSEVCPDPLQLPARECQSREYLKKKNNLAQKNIRDRRKRKFDLLEDDVRIFSEAVSHQEKKKAELLAQIQALKIKQAQGRPQQSKLLPQLQEAQQDFAPAVSWANFDPEGNGAIVLSELFDTPRRLTREQAGKLSLQDVRSIQGEYMLRAGELLAQNPEDKTDSPACQLLKDLMWEWRGLSSYISCWLPSFNFRLHDVLAPSLSPESTPPIDHKRVLRVMNLSREQKVALRRECQSYIKKLETMFQKRRQLVAALKDVPQSSLDQRALLQDLAAFSTTVRKLLDNSDEAHLNNCYFWGQILNMPHKLTESQEARALLECHPHYSPDICRLFGELNRDLQLDTGGAAAGMYCTPSIIHVTNFETSEDEPYMEMVEKLVTEFARIDYRSIKGAQMSKALLKRPLPAVGS